MGKVSKGAKCSVVGCQNEAIRSLHVDKVTDAGLEVQGARRAYLCKDHYKRYKKATKQERRLDKWRYGGRIT